MTDQSPTPKILPLPPRDPFDDSETAIQLHDRKGAHTQLTGQLHIRPLYRALRITTRPTQDSPPTIHILPVAHIAGMCAAPLGARMHTATGYTVRIERTHGEPIHLAHIEGDRAQEDAAHLIDYLAHMITHILTTQGTRP